MRTFMLIQLLLVLVLLASLSSAFDFDQKKKKATGDLNPRDAEYQTDGVLLVDAILFDKIIPSKRTNIILMVANKANVGKKMTDYMREEFIEMAKKGSKSDDGVLFAQMLINGSENRAQAERVGVENFAQSDTAKPEFFLYRKGEIAPIPIKPENDDFTVADIMAYVSKTTGVNFSSRGTIMELAEAAQQFMSTKEGSADRTKAYNDAKELAAAYPADSKKKSEKEQSANAGWYLTAMQKIIEKGNGWIDTELKRLRDIIVSDKVSNSRKDEFKRRLNIVQSFKEAPELLQYVADEPVEEAVGAPLE